MSKRDFIERLTAALNGRISPNLVTDNVNYYEDYINMEIRKGRSEEEVLRMLGDPRLIARTIIETSDKGNPNGYKDVSGSSSAYRETDYTGETQNSENGFKSVKLPGWLLKLLAAVIIILVFYVIFSVLSFLAPIIIPLLVVMFLVKLFRDWLN